MPKSYCNLDALITREDIYIKEQIVQETREDSGVKTSELEERSIWFKSLRKPDFQRETASWEPEKIADLVECFVKGHFIPSLIMWRATDGKLFVIDGAHRLSALIAWVRDDYGDKDLSIRFFKNEIPAEQKKIADKTRTLINNRVGAYADMAKVIDNPHSKPEAVIYARNSGTIPLAIQWVRGDARTAELSFLKINQSSTPIDPTEFQMIESRRKPNAIAARALMRAGVGHKFWGSLEADAQQKIEKTAKEIYDKLFLPPLESPIHTLELPVAGRGYSAESVRLLFDFVNLANDTVINQRKLKVIDDDSDGETTMEYLHNVSKVIDTICTKSNRSLGLHPAVYFYSMSGRYQPTAFLAAVKLVMEFEKEDKFHWFTKHRAKFEDFLVSHRYFVNQIVNQFGSGFKGHTWVLALYKDILNMVATGQESEIAKALIAARKWRLKEQQGTGDASFSTETKNFIVLRDSLANAIRCNICGARIHRNSYQIDHTIRKQDGGSNSSDNGKMAHPFCNTTYKEANLAPESN
jgi:hypothetical protein